MQDITEQQELAQEITDAISKPVGLGEQFDEVGDLQIYGQIFGLKFYDLHISFTLPTRSRPGAVYNSIQKKDFFIDSWLLYILKERI